jgi:hypothetical protein
LGGGDEPIDSVKIAYLSGHIDAYYGLQLDTTYHFTEGETYHVDISSQGIDTFCEGDTLVLSVGSHHEYLWNTGDTTATIAIATPGTYYVSVGSAIGLQATDSISIGMTPAPLVVFDIEAIYCYGDSTGGIALTNLSGVPPANVDWSNGMTGDTLSGLPNGTYNYTFEDANGCTASGEITLGEPPFIVLLAIIANATGGMNNGSIYLNTFGGTPPFTFYLDSMQVGSYVANLAPAVYGLEVYDDNLCREHLEITIDALLSSGAAEETASFAMYPNPASDLLTIEAILDVNHVNILDMSGKQVRSFPGSEINKYQLGQLSSGMYLVVVVFENGLIEVQKLGVLE